MALQIEEEAGVTPHIITLDEYERMWEAEVFGPHARIELIRGTLVDMAPTGPAHWASAARNLRLFIMLVGDDAIVWPPGNSIRLPQSNSCPQPDISILLWR